MDLASPTLGVGGSGSGSLALTISSGDEVTEDLSPPGYQGATNQEMELLACAKSLQEALELDLPASVRRLVIRTDSSYLQDNYKRAIFEWPKQKWLTRSGAPVENAEDWKELVRWYKKACERFDVVRIDWVKGHSGNPHNKAAHRLAVQSARRAFNKPRKVVHVRRKRTDETVSRGSVLMKGQTMTIRVTQSGILNVQKLWRCTYEVVSAVGADAGRRDVIICDKGIRLDAGHTYEVRVNEDTRNPRVVDVLREVAEVVEEEPDQQQTD